MISRLTIVLLTVIFILACKSPTAIQALETTKDNWTFVDSIVQELIKPFPENTQIAIGIVKKNNQTQLGYLKQDSLVYHIDNKETLFQIGSITKVFTGVLLGDAVNNGKLKLTDSLSTLLPFNFKNGGSINLQHLTTHTNGIYSYPLGFQFNENYVENDPYKHVTVNMVKKFFENDFVPQSSGGEKYEYSNLGTGLLAYIIAKSNSTSLKENYEKVILNPAEMNQTCLNLENCKSMVAQGLDNSGEETPSWTLPGMVAGAGGLLSNTNDMCNFISAVVSNNFEAIETSKTPLYNKSENTQICMNWFYSNLEGFGKWYWHGGGTGGFTSALFIDDNTDNGIIVLSNVSAFHPKSRNIEKIAMDCLKKINEL